MLDAKAIQSTIAAFVLGGCTQQVLPPPPPAALAGCANVRPGPVCIRPDGPVRIWLPTPPDAVRTQPAVRTEGVDAGTRLTAENLSELTIRIEGHAPMQVRFQSEVPGVGRLLHARGKTANRNDQTEAAVPLLTRAAAQQAADGDRSGAAQSAQILAFIHRERGALTDARQVLTRWSPPAADGQAIAMHAFFQGLIAYASANPRGALRSFERAESWTRRLSLKLQPLIRQQKAVVFADLGRHAEALAVLGDAETRAQHQPPCARGDLLTNLGWVLLSSDQATSARTGRVLKAAAQAYRDCPSANATKRANAAVNHGLWMVRSGQRTTAFAFLPDPRIDPEVRVWRQYLNARLQPTPKRAAALVKVAGRAADAGFARLQWRALVDAGVAVQSSGHIDAAIEHYEAAEAVVQSGVLAIPADAGRGAFAADRRESAVRLVAALRSVGRLGAAMDASRRARRRVLTTLPAANAVERLDPSQQARWEAAWSGWRAARAELARQTVSDWTRVGPALESARQARIAQGRRVRTLLDDALRHLAPHADSLGAPLTRPALGEAILTWSQTPAGGWLVFLQDTEGTIAASVEPPAWTAPVLSRLARARQVRVLAVGPTLTAPLALAGRPAIYALDIRPRPRPVPQSAAIVSDPTGDLPSARAEGERLRPLLARTIAQPKMLSGAAATAAALRAVLADVDHLHYAGHGRYAGLEGWESALPLRDGQLDVGDVLALPRVPNQVVLSGCETGQAAGSQAVGVGLAHAFLLRGAQRVIAPVESVDDERATQFSAALYSARLHGAAWPEAVQRAARASGVSAYRIFVP